MNNLIYHYILILLLRFKLNAIVLFDISLNVVLYVYTVLVSPLNIFIIGYTLFRILMELVVNTPLISTVYCGLFVPNPTLFDKFVK